MGIPENMLISHVPIHSAVVSYYHYSSNFNTDIMPKPEKTDYPSFYAGYVELVPYVKLPDLLKVQGDNTKVLFSGLTEAQADYAYAPGKWSLKEMFGHIIDAERVFAYRALCMARGDQQSLPGMDQDQYMAHVNFAGRSMESLIEEYDAVRQSSIHFFGSLSENDFEKTGTANNGHFTVNALMHIIAGHELHHMVVIKERYL